MSSCRVRSAGGKRFNDATLQVTYKGLSISDVLDLSVRQACELFANHRRIRNILNTLMDVGLGYIKLGQAATTLSGGEAQRIKLARELSKADTGDTLYILDEPTTGLHFEDIKHLLGVLQRLVSAGNTVVVIEHNLDVVKTADWVIDLGAGRWPSRRQNCCRGISRKGGCESRQFYRPVFERDSAGELIPGEEVYIAATLQWAIAAMTAWDPAYLGMGVGCRPETRGR